MINGLKKTNIISEDKDSCNILDSQWSVEVAVHPYWVNWDKLYMYVTQYWGRYRRTKTCSRCFLKNLSDQNHQTFEFYWSLLFSFSNMEYCKKKNPELSVCAVCYRKSSILATCSMFFFIMQMYNGRWLTLTCLAPRVAWSPGDVTFDKLHVWSDWNRNHYNSVTVLRS